METPLDDEGKEESSDATMRNGVVIDSDIKYKRLYGFRLLRFWH